jgi:RHS repeat-associated protein
VRKEIIPAERADFPAMVKLALEKGKDALPKSRVVEFLWDGDVLAGELDPEAGPRFFVHEPGTFDPLLQQEQGAVFTYVNDHLGTPKELVDQDGRVAWAAAHSAWGRVLEVQRDPKAKQVVESPFRLSGQYHDEETGLCYTRYRYFDPALARWLSPDPLGLGGGPNAFAFDASPVDAVDPLGLCPRKVRVIVLAERHDPRAIEGASLIRAWAKDNGLEIEMVTFTPGRSFWRASSKIQMMLNNRWVNQEMDRDSIIVNVGRNPADVQEQRPLRPFYQGELTQIEARKYPVINFPLPDEEDPHFADSQGRRT